ncbi:MAG: phosphotransferase [Turicibacter sp.]
MEINSELTQIIEENYPLSVESIIAITPKVMKVRTANKEYILKATSENDDFIMKQLFAYKAMKDNILPIYRTKNQKHYVTYQQQQFYLTDFVQTIPVPLEKQIHYYTELLEKLHDKTRLVVEVSDEELARVYEKEYTKLEASYKRLQSNMETYELKLDRSPYEWYFMMVYPMLYQVLQLAHNELKQFYDLLKSEKKLPICLIHGDVNISNVLVSETATYLVNFEKSMFSIPAVDMNYLLENYHQVPGINSILIDYAKKEAAPILKHYFFFKSLCFDAEELEESLQPHSLTKIALLNERIAPHMLAMQLYDTINKPTTVTPKDPQE